MVIAGALLLSGSLATVAIDSSAWTQASRIDWPGDDRLVTLVQPHSLGGTCWDGARLPDPDSYRFLMGEACGRLVVFMDLRLGLNADPRSLIFISQHEAFHLAAQMYGSVIPIDFVELEPNLAEENADGLAFSGLYSAIGRSLDGGSGSCSDVAAALRGLTESQRRYINYKAFWEWPAEFYAQQVVFAGDFDAYVGLRSELFAHDNSGYQIFVTGVRVGQQLDQKLGRAVWQEMVANGRSMLDLFLESGGCEAPARGPGVRFRKVELPSLEPG